MKLFPMFGIGTGFKMKNIGIISLYHDNYNYGGMLQAFSLVYVLNKNKDVDAKQITYDFQSDVNPLRKTRMESFLRAPYGYLKKVMVNKASKLIYLFFYYSKEKSLKHNFDKRKVKFKEFETCIPHTELFGFAKLHILNNYFDCFICGSDQVWNPDFFRNAYFFFFVNRKEKKYSFLVSMGKDSLIII